MAHMANLKVKELMKEWKNEDLRICSDLEVPD